MDITEKWLGEIGGWAAMKTARSLVAAGCVSDFNRDGDTLIGTVASGKMRHRAGLRVRSRTDVDNLCTCPTARRGGMICEHSLAVALAAIGTAPPPVPLAARAPLLPSKPQSECPPGQFSIFLPDDLIAGKRKDKTHVFLRFEPGGTEKETGLCQWLAGHGLKCQTMPLALSSVDLDGLLTVVGAHPCVFAGKPVTAGSAGSQRLLAIAPEPVRLPVVIRESDGGWIEIALQDQRIVPLFSAQSAGDGNLTCWWFCPETQTVFRTGSASGEIAGFLRNVAGPSGGKRHDLAWLGSNIDTLEALLDLNLVGETIANLKILPVPCTFALALDGSSQFVEAELRARFGGAEWLVSAESDGSRFPVRDEKARNVFYVRDLARENRAARILEQAGFEVAGAGKWRMNGARNVLHFYGSILPRLQTEFEITELDRWRAATRSWLRITPSFKAASSDGKREPAFEKQSSDWLSLDIAYEAASGFRISRNEVMQMIRTGRRDVQDAKGRRYVLDADSCEEFEESLRDVDVQLVDGGARVRSQFSEYLTGIDESVARQVEPARTLAEMKNQLGPLGQILRDYQMDGVAWMERHGRLSRGALLADDMGLGKTIQTIAAILLLGESESKSPVIVVCPKSLVSNWEAEIQKFAQHLTVASWIGSDRKAGAEVIWKADVILTTYQLVVRDVEFFMGRVFRAIVLDEASYIRNPDTEAARALRQLKSEARFALTGTPVENSVRDLWSIFQFLEPGYLGTREVFRERFEKPINDQPGSSEAASSSKRLKRLIRPYMLRRTKAEVLPELPEKIEQVLWCDLTPAQSEVYRRVLDEGLEEIRQARKRSGDNGARMTMFTVLLRLRQICCDLRLSALPQPVLDRLTADDFSGKTAALGDRVAEIAACNGKVLIFSQFVQFLRLIRSQIEGLSLGHAYLDGATQDRAAAVRKFQTDPECRVFLVSLKAGGYGLNLTEANHVFLMDPWWNPAVEAQAIDRAHRMGQNRAVTAMRMITRGTVEERILKLQARKRGLIEVLVDDGGSGGGLSADELSELIGGAA